MSGDEQICHGMNRYVRVEKQTLTFAVRKTITMAANCVTFKTTVRQSGRAP